MTSLYILLKKISREVKGGFGEDNVWTSELRAHDGDHVFHTETKKEVPFLEPNFFVCFFQIFFFWLGGGWDNCLATPFRGYSKYSLDYTLLHRPLRKPLNSTAFEAMP